MQLSAKATLAAFGFYPLHRPVIGRTTGTALARDRRVPVLQNLAGIPGERLDRDWIFIGKKQLDGCQQLCAGDCKWCELH
jgi:hypothetical protein